MSRWWWSCIPGRYGTGGMGVGLCGEQAPFSGWLLDEMKGES
jgi:hypothetical protein